MVGSSLRLKDLEEIDGLKRAIYDLQFINDCIEFDDYYAYYDEEEETKKEKPKWYYIYMNK